MAIIRGTHSANRHTKHAWRAGGCLIVGEGATPQLEWGLICAVFFPAGHLLSLSSALSVSHLPIVLIAFVLCLGTAGGAPLDRLTPFMHHRRRTDAVPWLRRHRGVAGGAAEWSYTWLAAEEIYELGLGATQVTLGQVPMAPYLRCR